MHRLCVLIVVAAAALNLAPSANAQCSASDLYTNQCEDGSGSTCVRPCYPPSGGPSAFYQGVLSFMSLRTQVTMTGAACQMTPIASASAFVLARRMGVCTVTDICPVGSDFDSATGFDAARTAVELTWPSICELDLSQVETGRTVGTAQAQANGAGGTACVSSWGNISASTILPSSTTTFLATTSPSAYFTWYCPDLIGTPTFNVDLCLTGFSVEINSVGATRSGTILSGVLGAQARAVNASTGAVVAQFGVVQPSPSGSPTRVGPVNFSTSAGFELRVTDVFLFGPDVDGNNYLSFADKHLVADLIGYGVADPTYVLRADANYDGSITLSDWVAVCSQWVAAQPCCPADYDASGAVDPDDLADFISDYFAGSIRTDLDCSGVSDPDDLSDYVSLHFSLAGRAPALALEGRAYRCSSIAPKAM